MFQAEVVEKEETHILCSIIFLKNRAIYEIMWKNTVKPDRPQLAIWRMRFTCWIPKATNTYSQYVTLTTFRLQQWWRKHASVLRYTYIACLV